MRVDIYTDASIVCGRGAWAVVVLREGVRTEHSAPLRGNFKSSTAVELCAIANALHWASKSGLILAGDTVRLWCDNDTAVNRVNGQYRNKMKTDSRLIEATKWVHEFRKARRFALEASHIKGHQRQDTDDPRAIYNQRCDELCSAIRDGKPATPFERLEKAVASARAGKARREARIAA